MPRCPALCRIPIQTCRSPWRRASCAVPGAQVLGVGFGPLPDWTASTPTKSTASTPSAAGEWTTVCALHNHRAVLKPKKQELTASRIHENRRNSCRVGEVGLVIAGPSSETLCDQKLMQVGKGPCTHTCGGLHVGPGRWVQHPRGDLGDHTGCNADTDIRIVRATFYSLETDPSPEQRMPTILNSAVVPDLGRMNGRSSPGAELAVLRYRGRCQREHPTLFAYRVRQGERARILRLPASRVYRAAEGAIPAEVEALLPTPPAPPPWPETHSKGRSPPHVNNALCGALTLQIQFSSWALVAKSRL